MPEPIYDEHAFIEGPLRKSFTQEDYSRIVKALDEALEVFRLCASSEERAEAAFRDFVTEHYFPVWRAMQAHLMPSIAN
jgi:hypothetical protein